ncbi:MAG: prolyl oligopeptidase family serine peptidase [Terriglobales bacterium]
MKRLKSSVKNLARLLLLIVLVAAQCSAASGQHVVPLHIQDLLDARQFGELGPIQFSPDGKWIVYTLQEPRKTTTTEDPSEYARTGVPSFAKSVDIFVVSTETRESRTLTAGKGANWAPAWSPDGRYIAFLSDRDGSGQAKVWVWQAATNNLSKLSDVIVRGARVEWMSGGEQLLTTVLPKGMSPEDYANRVLRSGAAIHEQQIPKTRGSLILIYESEPRPSQENVAATNSDPWSLEGYLGDLALLDIRDGAARRLVRSARIARYEPSPNGSQVAFTSPSHFEAHGSQQILWSLNAVSTSTGQVTELAKNVRLDYDGASFSWSPDSTRLAFVTGGPLEAEAGAVDCYVVVPGDGPPQNVTTFPSPGHLYRQSPPLWSDSGQSIYINRGDSIWTTTPHATKARQLAILPGNRVVEPVMQDNNRLWSPDGGRSTVVLTFDETERQSAFYGIELGTGQITKLWENGQCYACVNTDRHAVAQPNGSKLAYLSQDSEHSDDLWMADSAFHSPTRLTKINPQLENYQMGGTRLIAWRSLDGEPLHGALLLPAGYQEGVRYPLIVWVYGGARGSDYVTHFGLDYGGALNMQLFATRGYAVLFPDAPQHLGTPMIDLAKGVLPGVEKVVELGIADPERLAVMGHSYGGYSVLSLLVQTKRFKVAVMEDGTGDLIAAYGQMQQNGTAFGTSVAEQGQELMGGTPWEFRDRYIENSPIFFLDRVVTPLLIVHGGDDRTIAPFLGDEVFVDLRRLGREVQYAKYEAEGHSPIYWSYANQVDLCNRIISWIDGHLPRPPR